MTKRTRWRRRIGAVAAAAIAVAAACSDPPRRSYDATVLFDEQTTPTLAGEFRSELVLSGVAPDGTLYIRTASVAGQRIWVRAPDGSYPPAPAELRAEVIESMAFDPMSGDLFVLSYPQGQAHIRRFHGDRVVQNLVPIKPDGGNFEENRKALGDEVGLFYDASSGSLLYADGSLYRIDATGAATVALPKPPLPEGHVGVDDDGEHDRRVAYAVNARTGTIYVAFTYFKATDKCRNRGGAVYRVESGGRLSHVAGGCVNGDDDYIDGGPYGLAADPTSDDLVAIGPGGAVDWISKGKSTTIYFPEEFETPTVVRGVGFDAAGHAYVGAGEKVAKITFRR